MYQSLDEFMDTIVLNNSLWKYLSAVVAFTLTYAVLSWGRSYIQPWLMRWAEKTESKIDDTVVGILSNVKTFFLVSASLYHGLTYIHFHPSIWKVIQVSLFGLILIQVLITMSDVTSLLIRHILFNGKDTDAAKSSVLKNIIVLIKTAIWIGGVLFFLDNLGFNVTSMVAGLGIGGIAIAMASQSILGDTFSSFTIYLDKPFEVGDFITVGDLMGTVEHVGLKTTRVRSLSGELLIFSNSDLTSSRIKNYKKMETRRAVFTIGVVYSTPLEVLKTIPSIIRQAIEESPSTRFDRAHFFKFDDFALTFEAVYFVLSSDYNVYMDTQQEINFRIREAFDGKGIDMAFPTQTVHIESAPDILRLGRGGAEDVTSEISAVSR